jgi:t-SNARE complex subunit (syntaxin)
VSGGGAEGPLWSLDLRQHLNMGNGTQHMLQAVSSIPIVWKEKKKHLFRVYVIYCLEIIWGVCVCVCVC